MTEISSKINTFVNRGVSIAPLVSFRIIFGTLLLFSTFRFLFYGWVKQLYIDPPFHFPYYGFEWLKQLPGNWMYLPFILMVLSAIGIILGAFYRLATTLFFICFTYVELIDKSTYLNHYYFVSLMCFLFIFIPAHRSFSIDVKRKPSLQLTEVPFWTIGILRLQLGIVYFYAGLAKINSDWLFEAQPLRLWLQVFRDTPLVGNLLASSWLAFVFSWFGCLYDLSIPFLLSFRKTRPMAYVLVIGFHILTWILFPIGVFPWVMIFSTLIFFETPVHLKLIHLLQRILRWTAQANTSNSAIKTYPFVRYTLICFLIFQLIFPFRYLCYPGHLFWTEEGYRFSWRVMLMEKKGYATFYVEDPKTNGSIEIDNTRFLTPQQIDQMSRQPDMILAYAHFLGETFQDTVLTFAAQKRHIKNPRVTADVFVTLNGKPNQQMVDRTVDLMKEQDNLKHNTWIRPYVAY